MKLYSCSALLLSACTVSEAFSPPSSSAPSAQQRTSNSDAATCRFSTATGSSSEAASSTVPTAESIRRKQKQALLGLIGAGRDAASAAKAVDSVLADPITKEPLTVVRNGGSAVIFGDSTTGTSSSGSRVTLRSSPDSGAAYSGRTDTYYNLLDAEDSNDDSTDDDGTTGSNSNLSELASDFVAAVTPLIPPPLRFALKATGLADDSYVPMRDLFTNPSVSFAYERGWRQGFAAAGFPGPDKEAEMVQEYFEPVVIGSGPSTVVDMSCATGLFTRRLTKSNAYDRVIGCDYSDSMLSEARRRINSDPELRNRTPGQTRLDLVRCDVGNIPMRTDSVNALHAGAAMHCWPDLDAALSEIYRVLKPGGRYFATTFLAQYFRGLQASESGQTGPSIQAFQYFASTDELKDMIVKAGFDEEKVSVEVLGTACVVIRAEK